MSCKTIANMSELQGGIDYIKDSIAGIDRKEKIKMMLLPETKMFPELDLTQDQSADIKKVETNE